MFVNAAMVFDSGNPNGRKGSANSKGNVFEISLWNPKLSIGDAFHEIRHLFPSNVELKIQYSDYLRNNPRVRRSYREAWDEKDAFDFQTKFGYPPH